MNKINFEELAKTLTFGFDYSFLEAGKDDDELQKVAEKRGLKLPCNDLAIFKGKFAFVDRTNLNGCSLPADEVAKSLETLVGKAIDFDHIRERIVGFWLDAELIDDTIYAYGAFFKANLAEDYELVKELMNRKNLGISFEAYGVREFKDDDTYDLTDIEWAGGALLINTKPAFPGAGVLEMSNKRVLEFASVMTAPDVYIKPAEDKKLEKARFYVNDFETIMRLCGEIVCPMCKAIGCVEPNFIDFEQNKVGVSCWACASNLAVELTPKSTIVLKNTASREIKEVTQMIKKGETEMSETKTEAPSIEKADDLIKTEEEVVEQKAEVEEVVDETNTETDNEEVEVVKVEETEITIDDAIAEAEAEVNAEATAEDEVTETADPTEVAQLKEKITQLEEKINKARDEGKVIGSRRSFLGDYAKDMTDDDVLDEVKYENATLKKKIAEIESKKTVEVSSEKDVKNESLEIGSKDEDKHISEVDEFARKVRKRAFSL